MVSFRAKLAKGEKGRISFDLDPTTRGWLIGLAQKEGWKEGSSMKITIEIEAGNWNESARKLLHAIRDDIAKAQGDASRQNKDALYENCKAECGMAGMSIDDMNKDQVNTMIRQMLDWAFEAEVDISRFSAEREAIRREMDEMA